MAVRLRPRPGPRLNDLRARYSDGDKTLHAADFWTWSLGRGERRVLRSDSELQKTRGCRPGSSLLAGARLYATPSPLAQIFTGER